MYVELFMCRCLYLGLRVGLSVIVYFFVLLLLLLLSSPWVVLQTCQPVYLSAFSLLQSPARTLYLYDNRPWVYKFVYISSTWGIQYQKLWKSWREWMLVCCHDFFFRVRGVIICWYFVSALQQFSLLTKIHWQWMVRFVFQTGKHRACNWTFHFIVTLTCVALVPCWPLHIEHGQWQALAWSWSRGRK